VKTHQIWPLVSLLIISTAANAQTGAPDKSSSSRVSDKATGTVKHKQIPEKLRQIQKKPYSLKGLPNCAALQNEVRELDVVLGPDVKEKVSKSKAKKRATTASNVAGSAIGGIIPFRGLIREASGAAAAARRYNRAVYAGTVRRGSSKVSA